MVCVVFRVEVVCRRVCYLYFDVLIPPLSGVNRFEVEMRHIISPQNNKEQVVMG